MLTLAIILAHAEEMFLKEESYEYKQGHLASIAIKSKKLFS